MVLKRASAIRSDVVRIKMAPLEGSVHLSIRLSARRTFLSCVQDYYNH